MASSRGALRDVVLAIAIVGGVLGGLFLYTGVWPPMVVVESGSMMHGVSCPPPAGQPQLCDSQLGYGKVGTIDPGDMVFVKKVSKVEDVRPMANAAAQNAGERNYGSPGDVVVYFPSNNRARTPIIHRAIAYVEVTNPTGACPPTGSASYKVFWDGRNYEFGPSGIYLPDMGFGPGQNFQENAGYRPCHSGFITKGDNPVSNILPDQATPGGTLPSQPVPIEWVEGKAVGELPWFGLIKLALSGDLNYPCSSGNVPLYKAHEPACDNGKAVRVLNANAPGDLWVMLGVSLAFIGIAPVGYDMYILQRSKERDALRAQGKDPGPTFGETLRKRFFPGDEAGPGAPEGADPRKAFEPPPNGPTPRAAPAPTRVAPPSPPPGAKPPAKFERVPPKKPPPGTP